MPWEYARICIQQIDGGKGVESAVWNGCLLFHFELPCHMSNGSSFGGEHMDRKSSEVVLFV